MRSAERIVPALAPLAGIAEDHALRTEPEWASSMRAEWRATLARFPRASIASMTGIFPERAARLVDGGAVPTPSEAASLDHALGTNASRHFPPRRPFVQRAFSGVQPDRFSPAKRNSLTESRQARVDAWAPRIEASGLSVAAIADAAELGRGRTLRVLRQGAIPTPGEVQRLVDVLGDEP